MRIITTAENRKDVVKAMENILNEKAKYLGPPSFAYTIGNFTIDRDGYIETDAEDEGAWMQTQLEEKGLMGSEEQPLTIEFPLEDFTVEAIKNLIYMIHSKQYLLEKAVGTRCLWVSDELVEKISGELESLEDAIKVIEEAETVGLSFTDERIGFTGFPQNEDEINAYMELLAHMVKAAKEQKRINPQEVREANEKYYMRIWLVRLGFGGKEAKGTRNILLARLKGHTAFRTEADKEKWKERYGKKAVAPTEE